MIYPTIHIIPENDAGKFEVIHKKFLFVANHRVMVFRCVTIQELSGDNYHCSYPYWFCNICLITENSSIIFLQRPIEFRTEEWLHGTRWSVRPTYKSEIFGCTQKKGSPFILPYPTCLLDNERNLETTSYYVGWKLTHQI